MIFLSYLPQCHCHFHHLHLHYNFWVVFVFLAWKVQESIYQPESLSFSRLTVGVKSIFSVSHKVSGLGYILRVNFVFSLWGFQLTKLAKLNLQLIQYHLQTISHMLYDRRSNKILKKTFKLYGPFFWMGFNCLKARATSRRQFTFYH